MKCRSYGINGLESPVVSTYKYMKLSTGRKQILPEGSPCSCSQQSYENTPQTSAGQIDRNSATWALLIPISSPETLALMDNAGGPSQAKEITAIHCIGASDQTCIVPASVPKKITAIHGAVSGKMQI